MNKIRPTSPAITTEELDQRTLLLIRRVLCTHSPPTTAPEELLPALTSSVKTDVQLYAFVAIIARDFIISWYEEISNDHAFIDEIIGLIAHCTRALEERLRKVDLEVLLLDEIPAVLDAHVRDFRNAVERHDTALAPYRTISEIFQNYQPHPGLANSTESERLYMKLLSNGILAILLPMEDLESNCERSLLREILSSLVFGNVIDKLSEPFMIYELITTVVHQLRRDEPVLEPISTATTSRRGSVKPRSHSASPSPLLPPPLLNPFERSFNILTETFSTLYSILASLHHLLLNPLPPRSPKRRPLIRSALPSCISTFFNLRALQPWLPTTLRLVSKPFASRSTVVGALLDDLLISKITPHLTSPNLVVDILKVARSMLFPGNALGPSRKYPTEEEKAEIRARAEFALLDVLPEVVSNMWWRGMDRGEMATEVGRNWLDVFEEKEINKVLIVRLIDLAVGRVLPELLESGGVDIRKQRAGLGGWPGEKTLETEEKAF